MFRVHCNKCFRHRKTDPTVPFHLAQCRHVICGPCLGQSSQERKCLLCGQALNTIQINRDMPTCVANYFEDPLRFQHLYRKISKFQADQRASDNLGFYRQLQQLEQNKRQLEGFCKMEAQLNRKVVEEKKRIAELRSYIAYHEDAQKRRRHSAHEGTHTPEFKEAWNTFVSTSDTTQSDKPSGRFCLDANMNSRSTRSRSYDVDTKDFRI
ncbi:uncharacterized protein LOC6550388 [Drosophila erecta]|uniref:RING-type domain-containing protein n=1 Tax=Drosophila erecta TaxID=7220 RepID=B3NVN2_DROER|nr:uncharacterized protein LOC6550388 [Drosophila erecta]EDV46697.1 uncharacterized protein Dere_GG19224 [Drosophila erecta]